jgi:hypothetical protein
MLRLVHHILVALLDGLSPRTRLTAENLLLRQQLPPTGAVGGLPILGGLHHRYGVAPIDGSVAG